MIDMQVPFLFKATTAHAAPGEGPRDVALQSIAHVMRPVIDANETTLVATVLEKGRTDAVAVEVRYWRGRFWRPCRDPQNKDSDVDLAGFKALLEQRIGDSPYAKIVQSCFDDSKASNQIISMRPDLGDWMSFHRLSVPPADFTSNEAEIEAAIKAVSLLVLAVETELTVWVQTELPCYRIDYYSDTGVTVGAVWPSHAPSFDDGDYWRATERKAAAQEARRQARAIGADDTFDHFTHHIQVLERGLYLGGGQALVSRARPAGLDFRA